MGAIDFAVGYNPKTETKEDVAKKIIYSLFIKRIKNKKPVVSFIAGDSGEGKSYWVLKLLEILSEQQGFKLIDYINDINVYVPIEYPKKIGKLLHEKRLKKVNMLAMHEAREVVKAKMWQSFLTQSVADVNAMSRTVKRMMIFIVSQFIRDISTDIRYTINYYMKVRRPNWSKARVYLNVMWKDDSDLHQPKLRKRRVTGFLIYPDGRYRRFTPEYLEFSMPSKEVRKEFENKDFESKSKIIKAKLDKLVKEMELEVKTGDKKINTMVEWYTSHFDSLQMIGKRSKKGTFKIKKDVRKMHELTEVELKLFEKKLNDKLKEKGYIENGEQ